MSDNAAFARAQRNEARAARVVSEHEASRRAARRLADEDHRAPRLDLTGATPRQRAAMCAATDELAQRERVAPAAAIRGWRRMDYAGAVPPGARGLCMLMPTHPSGVLVRLAVDLIGRLRRVDGDGLGSVVTVSEAVRLAKG